MDILSECCSYGSSSSHQFPSRSEHDLIHSVISGGHHSCVLRDLTHSHLRAANEK